MSQIHFMNGNEAAASAAIRAGLNGFFFYPLTPSSEIGEYMAMHLEDTGGVFVQAESELAVINMMYGGAAVGARVMTGTSGVGFSLMTEGISYMAGSELPGVIIDVQRAGPGLGSLEPTQADYNQITRGCGHGGALIPVYAPASAQEIVDFVGLAFDTADRFRTPVIITYEGYTGQMMEKVTFPEIGLNSHDKNWCLDDNTERKNRVIHSGYATGIEGHLECLHDKFEKMTDELQLWESYMTEDAEIILVAAGIVGRICKSAVSKARAEGLHVGFIRPRTLSPFPTKAFSPYKGSGVRFLTVEINGGMMANDVVLALGSDENTEFYRDSFARLPSSAEVLNQLRSMIGRQYNENNL